MRHKARLNGIQGERRAAEIGITSNMSSAFSVVASEVVVFVKMWTLWKYDNNPQPPLHSTLLHSPAPDSTTKDFVFCDDVSEKDLHQSVQGSLKAELTKSRAYRGRRAARATLTYWFCMG